MLTGAGAVVAGGTVAGIGAVISGLGITVLFANSNDHHGKPNSFTSNGYSDRIYDENGNLIYRRDYFGRAHFFKEQGRVLPHTHKFIWKFIKGSWKIIKEIVLPF